MKVNQVHLQSGMFTKNHKRLMDNDRKRKSDNLGVPEKYWYEASWVTKGCEENWVHLKLGTSQRSAVSLAKRAHQRFGPSPGKGRIVINFLRYLHGQNVAGGGGTWSWNPFVKARLSKNFRVSNQKNSSYVVFWCTLIMLLYLSYPNINEKVENSSYHNKT